MSLLIKNIKGLVGYSDKEKIEKKKGSGMMQLDMLTDAWLYIEDGRISSYGTMSELPFSLKASDEIDAYGKFVLPSWIDCHTHLVFPASREQEFVMKIKGASYEEIAASGGGILNSAKKLSEISEEELLHAALHRLDEVIRMGTGAIEIKSGYGLSLEGELKMLRVINELKKSSPIPVRITFLGAHAIPAKFKDNKRAYLDLMIHEMLPEIKSGKLADYIDIFIEKGFFNLDDASRILEAGIKAGLKPRLHVDQLTEMGGVPFGVRYSAISVDHLEQISADGIKALQESETMPVLLPACSFYLGMPYPPARKMIQAGLPVVLASDYNPGSSPSGNMNFVLSLACIYMKMLPEEAINAATVNAAFALEMENQSGTIRVNAEANLIITKALPSLYNIPYSFGNHSIDKVIVNGKLYEGMNYF